MSKNLMEKLNTALETGSIFEYVDSSFAMVQVLSKLGFSNKGQYIIIVRKFLIDNDIDTSHFTPNGLPRAIRTAKICLNCGNEFGCVSKPDKEQVTCSRACSNTYFRSGKNNGNFIDGHSTYRYRALSHYGPKCNRCGYCDNELGLDVHHIDEDRDNNSIENLEVLCAICHTIHHRDNGGRDC